MESLYFFVRTMEKEELAHIIKPYLTHINSRSLTILHRNLMTHNDKELPDDMEMVRMERDSNDRLDAFLRLLDEKKLKFVS